MNILECGYMKDYPVKRAAIVNFINKHARGILGDKIYNKVRYIKVVYFKPDREEYFDFRPGFTWLLNDDIITIKIPPYYMMWPTHFIGHELAHVKQIAEGRLKSHDTQTCVSYRSAVNKPYIHHKGKRLTKMSTNHDVTPPWETEAVNHHHNVVFNEDAK